MIQTDLDLIFRAKAITEVAFSNELTGLLLMAMILLSQRVEKQRGIQVVGVDGRHNLKIKQLLSSCIEISVPSVESFSVVEKIYKLMDQRGSMKK